MLTLRLRLHDQIIVQLEMEDGFRGYINNSGCRGLLLGLIQFSARSSA
jgi:hypothetical protein